MTDSNIPAQTERTSIEIPDFCSSLFRSNACPSIEACTDIKLLIEQHESQLATLEGQVEHLRQCLADMEGRQAHTKDTLVKLHATLAPIKRLPPEVLSEIFERCLDDGSSRDLKTARAKTAPMVLGRVCRMWRTVTHATPRLWRDISINVCEGRYSDEMQRDALPVLQTWLAHSGGLPLHLVLACKTERVLPGLVHLFATIAAHAARWKTVCVRLQNATAIHGLVCRTFAQCTALTTFDMSDGGHFMSYLGMPQSVEEAQPLCFDLSSAPLRQLTLSLTGLALRDVRAPWAMLTRLSFMQNARSSTTSITDYIAVLRQCVVLRECGIVVDGGVRDVPLEPLTLPMLECLQVHVLRGASHTTQMGDFLSVLDAPGLRMLAIEDCCPRREAVLYCGPLGTFLRAHGTVRSFKFSTSSKGFTAEDMVGLVKEAPWLTELEYRPDEESSPGGLLEALTPGEDGECLLPNLQRLFVYWDTTETVNKVGDMIERRYAMAERGVARLRHLSCKPARAYLMYDCMPPQMLVENLAARLEPLCRRGLEMDWEAYRYVEFGYS